jgi:hypothetical protein
MSNITKKGDYPLDMSEKEIRSLEEFIEDGLPGILSVPPEKIHRMIEMYFDGQSYQDISLKLGIKKNIVLYISYKHNFYESKLEHYENMIKHLKEKVDIAENRSINLIVDTMMALESYYRNIFNRYAITKDPKVIESADFENFKMYLKCMEILQKIKNPDSSGNIKVPQMGLNLPNGGILKKIDDNTVEVSPLSSMPDNKSSKLGEVLEMLAKLREEKESKENK